MRQLHDPEERCRDSAARRAAAATAHSAIWVRTSETLSDLQLELLAEEEPGATREEVEAEARREPTATQPAARAQTASGPEAVAGESAARRTA